MKFHIYCAMSLDGFIADKNGGVSWLEPYQDFDYGYKEFLAQINTVIMGRKSYEQARSFGEWSYPGKRSIVLTTQTLDNLPPEVETTPGPIETLAQDLRKNATGDVWIMGGAQVMGAFLDAGIVDSMDVHIIPVLLGAGVPLLRRTGGPVPLALLETKKFANGVVHVLFAPR